MAQLNAPGAARVTGRFAPSPTGALHLGSLFAATGSYLQARASGGRWLLRIEDVDTTRCRPNAEALILRTLELFGFEWDGPVLRQSTRQSRYREAIEQLSATGQLFRCACSRRDISAAPGQLGPRCIGRCAARQSLIPEGDSALRFAAGADIQLDFPDLWQGPQSVACAALGDVVLRRRDGLHAYQLAVVVDDADQGVNQVVRGADLLASTPWQILLQRSLGLAQPGYGHLPLLLEPDGRKLSKSQRSAALQPARAANQLYETLRLLQQSPPADLAGAAVAEIWPWALANWQPAALVGQRALRAPAAGASVSPPGV